MSDFFEIDFLDVEAKKSGDAITLRYRINGLTYIHVVDAGYADTGDLVVSHVNKYYGAPPFIDHVVVTHQDRDHSGGIGKVLESFKVGTLWMLRPWSYAAELLPRFARFSSPENLAARLKEIFPNIAALEEIAVKKQITIREPFQGASIGAFTVMAPARERYLSLIVESDKTPQIAESAIKAAVATLFSNVAETVANIINSVWGEEKFSSEGAGAENETSVVQYATLCGKKILLTGDAGREGLEEAANYAPMVGLQLPGIDRFQVPHHGSRRNVSTEILDRWLGQRLPAQPASGQELFSAIISAAKEDAHHPRKSVIRAMIHRGAKVVSTDTHGNLIAQFRSPDRADYSSITEGLPYPAGQEE